MTAQIKILHDVLTFESIKAQPEFFSNQLPIKRIRYVRMQTNYIFSLGPSSYWLIYAFVRPKLSLSSTKSLTLRIFPYPRPDLISASCHYQRICPKAQPASPSRQTFNLNDQSCKSQSTKFLFISQDLVLFHSIWRSHIDFQKNLYNPEIGLFLIKVRDGDNIAYTMQPNAHRKLSNLSLFFC